MSWTLLRTVQVLHRCYHIAALHSCTLLIFVVAASPALVVAASGGTASSIVSKPLVVTNLTTDADDTDLPPYWEPQEYNCVVVSVKIGSPEWSAVTQRFHASLKQNAYHIIRIERIQVGNGRSC